MKKIYLLLSFLIFCSVSIAQKKSVTLEDVWTKNTFKAKSVEQFKWMKNSEYYSSLKNGNIVKINIADPSKTEELYNLSTSKIAVNGYSFNETEDKILIATNEEKIYRRSSKADYYLYNIVTKQINAISNGGPQSYATFSPDGQKIAFVRSNNLFMVDVNSKLETQITKDGRNNAIINGSTDWVYEEEFGFAQGFFWSPDSKRIAFYAFDESKVLEYNMQMWGKLYPKDYKFKYPKAGETNALVGISIFNLADNNIIKVDVGPEKDQYIPRVQWTKNSDLLSFRRLNRLQNKLDLLHANAANGESKLVLSEESKTYVDLEFNDHLTYLADGKSFINTSEKSGFKHIYQFDMAGKQLLQLSEGNWEVTDLKGIDEKNKMIYFTSTEISPLERHLYSLQYEEIANTIKGTKAKKNKKLVIFKPIKKQLTQKPGSNKIEFSDDFKYYVESNSSAIQPANIVLKKAVNTEIVRELEVNTELIKKHEGYIISSRTFFSFKLHEGTNLNGWMIKPTNFDENKKYPVLQFVYGGPGSQTVTNDWNDANFYWYQVLAEKGYIIVSVDNRGTGARGKDFRHLTYYDLGKIEVQDQIETAKYLGNLPYIDKTRIGIWGWSYGGFMASNCILQGAEVFKAAIAVAPVTNWRFYDTIYTERYNGLPSENPNGYDSNSPANHAAKLKGNFLLIHGTGDDNVHYQNAITLHDALIKANKQFTSFYYPNRNHGIAGGNTRLHLFTMMTDWLVKNL